MQVLGNKIFIRITKESRESIFSKEIVKDNGEKVRLFINVPATDDIDARKATLFVQTAIVESVPEDINWIKKGDMAIIDYTVCNDTAKFVKKEGEDEIYWIPALTTYHKEQLVAYKTRRSNRDQIVHNKGDYNDLSPLLGVIRDNVLIPNDPYVFLEHESNVIQMVSASGILYSQKQKIVKRIVLAAPEKSQDEYGIAVGTEIMVDDFDIFDINIDGLIIQAVCDKDVMLTVV